MSEEQKIKISKSHKGIKISETHKQALKESWRVRKLKKRA
jgi:NOL1/NOP2/fmu family ribosome biogenesis protein